MCYNIIVKNINPKENSKVKYLLPYLKKYKAESILAPLFKMLEAIFDLTVPMVVAQIINQGIASGDKNYIIIRFVILIAMALAGLLCSFTAQYFAAKAAVGTASALRYDLLKNIQSLGFSELDNVGSSTLITRMTSDINQVQNGLNMFLRLFLRSPFIVFGAMIMAFTINFKISAIFAIVIPILFIIVFGIMLITKPMYKNQQSELDKVTRITRENLNGVRVIRAFSREKAEYASFEKFNSALEKIQLKAGKISALMNPLTYVVINGGIILILWLGAKYVNSGAIFSGDVIALVNYISQILVELVKLANLVIVLGRSIVSMGRVGQALDLKPTMKFGTLKKAAQKSDKLLEFKNVGLKYSGGADHALSNISFFAESGQTIGIIGSTGSGKSSLAGLISRFYDATDGEILYSGEHIKNYSKEFIRKNIITVMQKTQLFAGTIKSNLLYGNPDATEEAMTKALETAQALDFVIEKGGTDARVEQYGRNFSGGQRQRLSIARAVIAKPEILILDDSSSALDYATDAKLRLALKKLKDTCTFIISQRTASIAHADKILVLDDGHLVAQGTHEQLLSECEIYREIHESTSKKEGE